MRQITEINKSRLELEQSRLATEIEELKKKKQLAAEYGDLRENAEYEININELNQAQARFTEIEAILSDSQVVKYSEGNTIGVGSLIMVKNLTDETSTPQLFLLDSKEDFLAGILGTKSPLGMKINGNPSGIYEVISNYGDVIKYEVMKESQDRLKEFLDMYSGEQNIFV